MCSPCCNEPPLSINFQSDNDCKCNCASSCCLPFFRRKSAESPTKEQVIALQVLEQKSLDTQIVLDPKRIKKKIKIKKTPKEGV